MRRRSYLRSAGLLAGLGLAGCLGSGDAPAAANEFGYETTTTDGVAVPLVPLADAIEWYRAEAGVFADARGQTAFDAARIAGAVHSPAPDGLGSDDPVTALDTGTRVVTYCGCPHHLSTLRGATLIGEGYLHTYAIDEGFFAWQEAGYPVAGDDVDERPRLYPITGRTDPGDAGGLAWVRHEPSGQREAAEIDAAGRFRLDVRFYDITPDSPVRLSTPSGALTGPIGRLSSGAVEV